MRHPTVDDVHRLYAGFGCVERTADLGNHPAGNRAVGDQGVDTRCAQAREQMAIGVEHAADVGEHQQLLSLQGRGHAGGDHVGVDVVTLVVRTHPHGADDRDTARVLQAAHDSGVYADHIADLPEINERARVGCVGHGKLLGL